MSFLLTLLPFLFVNGDKDSYRMFFILCSLKNWKLLPEVDYEIR